MRRRSSIAAGILLSLAALFAIVNYSRTHSRPAAVPSSRGDEPPGVARFHDAFRTALAAKADWNYQDHSLREIVRNWEQRFGFPVRIHQADSAQELADLSLTLRAKNLSTRSAVQLLLEPYGLELIPYRDHALVIRGETENRYLIPRTYPVGDLRQPHTDDRGRWHSDLEALQELLTQVVAPHHLTVGSQTLMTNETWDRHERIEHLLAGLRQLQQDFAAAPRSPPIRCYVDLRPTEAPEVDLDRRRDFSCSADNYFEWRDAVQQTYEVPLAPFGHLFTHKGEEFIAAKFQGELPNARLREVLTHFLRPHFVTFHVRRDVVLLGADERPPDASVRAYPVWDLAPSMAGDVDRDRD